MQGEIVRGEGRWPNLERWFDAMETRDTFVNIRSDHYTHVHDLPPQLGGKTLDALVGQLKVVSILQGLDFKSTTLM